MTSTLSFPQFFSSSAAEGRLLLLLELESSLLEEVLLLFLEEETGAGLEEVELVPVLLVEVLTFSELVVTSDGEDVESFPWVHATMQRDMREIINPF